MDECGECSQHNQKEEISEAMCTTDRITECDNRWLYFTISEQKDKSLLSDCSKLIKASDNFISESFTSAGNHKLLHFRYLKSWNMSFALNTM